MDVLTADLLLVADSDFSRYRPAYVDAFFENRVPGDDQSIEEWTAREGRTMFSADEIYQPCSIGIRVMGSEANLFQFDATQPTWCDSLTSAVREMLVAHQLASDESDVKLVDIRGDPISNTTPMHEIEQGGELLVTVDGKRLLDETRLARQIGLPLATPVSHAPNKDELLEDHVRNLIAVDIRDLVLEALSRVENMVAAEAMICNEDDPSNLLKPIAALIKENAGHARSFAHLLDIHAAPDVVEALQNARVTDNDFAEDIAGAVLDEVAQSMQAHNMRISDYFTAKQMENSNLFASVGASGAAAASGKPGAVSRTIFGSQVRTHTEQIGQILNECPTTRHMFQNIVDHALFENQPLEGRINIIIKKGCDKHRRRNKRSAYRHGKNNAHRHNHHRHMPALKHGAKVRDYHFRDHHDHSRMHRKLHRLMQIAPAPGTQPIVVQENWHGKKEDWHRGEGHMENYRGEGSFPHYGLHDARYSQNTSVSDGGRGYGPGSSDRDAKIRDYKYSAEYEHKHGRHYRDEVAGVKKPGPRKDKEEEDGEDGVYDDLVLEKVHAPAMALHKEAPALESVKTSPDTKTITVTKDDTPATLPPAAEVVKVKAAIADEELIAATLRSSEILQEQEVSEKDMALIRATLRSAEAVTETSFAAAANRSKERKKPVVVVAAAAASKSTSAASPAISAPVPVREEPPSMQMFSKGDTPAAATVTGLQGGYKVHQRVVAPAATPVVVSKTPVAVGSSSSPKPVVAALPKVVLPVDTHLSDAALMDDDDLNMFLIPQATINNNSTPTVSKSIRV
jgi:hypothetical protein